MCKGDWRLTNQLNYLNNKQIIHVKYEAYAIEWEHEHCEFCYKKIPENTQIAYCTPDKYYWICETCYNDFKGIFQWDLIAPLTD